MAVAKKQTTKNIARASASAIAPQKKSNKNLWTGILAIVIGVGILFIGAISVMNKNNTSRHAEEINQMTQYLTQQYGKEFVVENYRIEGEGLAVQGTPTGDAHPIDDPTLQFEVRDSGNYERGEHTYYDHYLQALWSNQGEESVEKFISAELPDTDSFYLEIRPIAGSQLESYESFKGTTLSLDEALATRRNDVRLTLTIRSGTDASSDEPSISELGRAFKVFDYVTKTGAGSLGAYYLYKNTDFNERDKEGEQLYQYSIGTDGVGFDSINTADDLRAYFKKIR